MAKFYIGISYLQPNGSKRMLSAPRTTCVLCTASAVRKYILEKRFLELPTTEPTLLVMDETRQVVHVKVLPRTGVTHAFPSCPPELNAAILEACKDICVAFPDALAELRAHMN